jgi:uncharacterized RDD family membrane protein YckC
MGSALLDTDALDPAYDERPGDSRAPLDPSQTTSGSAKSAENLRLQVAERLAAHRSRRNTPTQQAVNLTPAPKRNSRIADAVAQRYANSPSYRAVLAAEAERATQQARAAAEVAALNAAAVAQAQQQLLESLQEHTQLPPLEAPRESPHEQQAQPEASNPLLWSDPAGSSRAFVPPHCTHRPAHKPSHRIAPEHQTQDQSHAALTVRLYEDEASAAHIDLNVPLHSTIPNRVTAPQERNAAEETALDEEIAFRQSPVFEDPVGPAMPLPANLIEFPRQLVAPRKARPRYAEGPLRADEVPAPGDGQLRIFEVDLRQISTTPAPDAAPQPQWSSLWLDTPESSARFTFAPQLPASSTAELDPVALAPPDAEYHPEASAAPRPLIDVASIPCRLMAVALDGAILLTALAAFTSSFVAVTFRAPLSTVTESLSLAHGPLHLASQIASQTGLQLRPALLTCVLTLLLLHLLYQTLFFTFSESTPGMRAVRIALCTFDDENPTRSLLRRRVLAVLISACPLGLGLLWAAFDEDRLTWHDRITRSYQRTY